MGSCQPLRQDLADCLMKTDCVLIQRNSPQQCLQEHLTELPQECRLLYKSYVECRRGMLDMRKRFRGNAPLSSPSPGGSAPGGVSSVSIGEEGGKEETR